MEAFKYNTIVEKDGEIKISGVPCKKGEKVEMILLLEGSKKTRTDSFTAIKLKTLNYKFDRDEINER